MAVRGYRDAQGRQRYLVEFQQRGKRILRRAPPNVTQAQAKDWETQIRRSLFDQKTLGKRPPLYLSEVIQKWLDSKPQKHMRDLTNKANALIPFVKGKTLEQAPEVAEAAAKSWTSTTRRTTAAPTAEQKRASGSGTCLTVATVNRRLCVLKASLHWAHRQGLTDHNLSARISLRRGERQKEVYLSKKEVARIATYASTEPNLRAAIFIAAYTGLRASELLGINSRANLQTATLTVLGKGGKSRVIPVPKLLRSYLSALPLQLSYWQLRDGFILARKAAGLPPTVTFHTLRHSFASWLINSGVDLFTVGKLLGHSSPQTTARYAHLATDTLAKAVRKL